jgi:5-methylcytosine-specific restriction endonuclease McrA
VLAELDTQIREYFAEEGDPSAIGGSPFEVVEDENGVKSIGKHLHDRYRSGQSTDEDIVKRAMDVQVRHCPYCGLFRRIKPHERAPERDHFLPKSEFPEYSLLAVNIVVACDDCNDAKGTDVLDEDDQMLFMHPYFDDDLGNKLLRASAEPAAGSDTFAVDFEITSSDDISNKVARQVETLDLKARYADGPLRRAVEMMKFAIGMYKDGAGLGMIRGNLQRRANDRLEDRPNDPVGLILEAVAQSEALEDILVQQVAED